jgi:tRNA A-37 threonylcarbamoyl transferase component Bud32
MTTPRDPHVVEPESRSQPHAGTEAETSPPASPSDGRSAAAARLCVPGYEILGELGRGAMGVVYQARQAKPNRLVALKMILAGGHASEADLARFATEAEAIARLQHPNIVQVYEVGTHEGQSFFSLEFCAGGSLDRKLGGTPLPPVEAARLVETLARAMHAAHRSNVIHRDLKPANVLLLEDGTPKITDFGLAKKLDEVGQTQSGVIMGTPSYMAPEQAGGKSKQIGPAADVYALGAILYECLTGRPPFKAATPLDTILQVLSDEPVPPSQLQSKTPKDLETICLKCLHKEAGKRYVTAKALAEDLGRFLRGEPIAARPVGRLERGWRWCRRNPALAGALAAVLLVFATGATVSTVLAILAGQRAEEATRARGEAQMEAQKAKDNESAVVEVLHLLPQTLSPVADRMKPKEAAEAAYLLSKAMTKTTNPSALQQLAEALSAVAARLGPKEAAAACDQAAATLSRAMSETRDPSALEYLARGLSAVAARVEPKEAAEAAAALSQAMTRTTNPSALSPLARGLSAVAARLGPKEAAAACGQAVATLSRAMSETRDPSALQFLAQDLSAAAGRLEPKEAGEAAAILSRAMTKTTDPSALQPLAQGLSAVTGRMEPKEAVATLSQAMTRTMNPSALSPLAQGLSAAAGRMEPKEAVATLSQAMTKATNPLVLSQLARDLSAVTGRMEPKEAVATLSQAMTRTTDPLVLSQLAEGLSAVAGRVEPKEAAEAAAALSQAMTRTTNPSASRSLVRALSAILRREDSWRKGSPRYGLIAAVGTLTGPGSMLSAPALLQLALAPPPLPAQALVDLLKQPFCIGEAQRLVLEQLTRHYGRPFADKSDFLRFAREQKLSLDLTTPPQRSEQAATPR